MPQNPFTPFPGQYPTTLVGLAEAEKTFTAAIAGDESEREFYKSLLVLGHHGSGRTTTLRRFAQIAEEHNWLTVTVEGSEFAYEQARANLLPDLLLRALGTDGVRAEPDVIERETRFSVAWAERPETTVRRQARLIARALEQQGRGLAIMIDDAEFCIGDEGQRLVRELDSAAKSSNNLVVVQAGIPQYPLVAKNLDIPTPTVGRRWIEVGKFDSSESLRALSIGFELAGLQLSQQDFFKLVIESGGFPAMVQSIGYEILKLASASAQGSLSDVTRALQYARMNVARLYYSRIVRDASREAVDLLSLVARASMQHRAADGGLPETVQLEDVSQLGNLNEDELKRDLTQLSDIGLVRFTSGRLISDSLPKFREYLIYELIRQRADSNR